MFSAMLPTIFCMRWYTNCMNAQKRAAIAKLVLDNSWSDKELAKEADRHAVSTIRCSHCASQLTHGYEQFLDLTDRENPFFMYTS